MEFISGFSIIVEAYENAMKVFNICKCSHKNGVWNFDTPYVYVSALDHICMQSSTRAQDVEFTLELAI